MRGYCVTEAVRRYMLTLYAAKELDYFRLGCRGPCVVGMRKDEQLRASHGASAAGMHEWELAAGCS